MQVSYQQYCAVVASAAYGQELAFGLGGLGEFLSDLKGTFAELVKHTGLKLDQLVAAFRSKRVFKFLTAIRFKIGALLKGFQQAKALLEHGLSHVFRQITDSAIMQQIRKGVVKIDDLLDRFPILRKVSGPAIAALLAYVWINSAFVGHIGTDLDITHIANALFGHFTLADLLTSEEGVKMLGLFVLGFTGIGFPWLGANLYNFLLALAYTGFQQIKDTEAMQHLRKLVHVERMHTEARLLRVTARLAAQMVLC